MMERGRAKQGTESHRTHPRCIHCLVPMVLLLSCVVSMEAPPFTWAATYQCVDKTGKTMLTNRPSELHSCHMLSEGTASALTPHEASMLPQVSPPPISSEIPSLPPYAPPMSPNWSTDSQGASTGSLPAPSPGALSSPSPPPPCFRGLNPLNPLSTPPCVRPDQSEPQPPKAALVPSR